MNKEKQRQYIIEIMKADEIDGIYSTNKESMILSPMKGIDNWLKKNGYIGKRSDNAASFVKEYKAATGNRLNTRPSYRFNQNQSDEFIKFTEWVSENKEKINGK